ncbi:MAG: YbjN domain-containing protein [Rhodobacteraceae bacterium]|nr:YbjN domain-containing protein [Paracoccaceae bacterium]
MKHISAITGLVLAMGMAAPATAQQVLASNPQSLMDYFFSNGVPAQLTTDSVGDPLVEFRVDSDTMQVFFYDCTDNQGCLALQFYAGYKVDGGVDVYTINGWNTDRRFVRSYLTDEGAARIEMDIATSYDGISHTDFTELYSLWLESVGLFEERIGW